MKPFSANIVGNSQPIVKETGVENNVMIINQYKSPMMRIAKALEEVSPWLYEKLIFVLFMNISDMQRKHVIMKKIQTILSQPKFPLFRFIEIETINRCNNTCSFCPVSRHSDKRQFRMMDSDLFNSIISQLQELNYSGNIGLFSNNEPLLDDRLFEFCEIAKCKLPKANLYLYTNGILLTIDKFKKLMKNLDFLVIDNYSDRLNMIKPVREVYYHCKKNNIYRDKIQIHIRKRNEIRLTRAGQSKNRKKIKPLESSCMYPFVQMVVRPDGKISLCCNDALGKITLGDLSNESILDVWNGDEYNNVRRLILKGRNNLSLCSGCDTIGEC